MKKLFLFSTIILVSLGATAQTGTTTPDELAVKLFEAVSKNKPELIKAYTPSYDMMVAVLQGDKNKANRMAGVVGEVLEMGVAEAYNSFVAQGVNFNLPVTKASTEVVKFNDGDFLKAIVKYNFTIGNINYIVSAIAVQVNGKWVLIENIIPTDQTVQQK